MAFMLFTILNKKNPSATLWQIRTMHPIEKHCLRRTGVCLCVCIQNLDNALDLFQS